MLYMSKVSREIPKAIAAFGEKQFIETGAIAVEVLRVKASVMRKHFRQLKGILYLVAVISSDRVRVYFFNASGIMVIGENLDQSTYTRIRKSSKLVAKFEKPVPLTPEELRIEATQELRDALGKALHKVSRFIALKEPSFPDIYVTRGHSSEISQNFGLEITEDGEFIFEENALSQKWIEGLLLRAAYLVHLDEKSQESQVASSVGNALGLVLLKGPDRQSWLQEWRKNSKDTEWWSIINHFVKHTSSYSPESYNWMASIINEADHNLNYGTWREVLSVLHDSIVVPLKTQDYHIIDGFCRTLSNTRQLEKRRHIFEAIHLAPRALCDPSPLDISLAISIVEQPSTNYWTRIEHHLSAEHRYLEISESKGDIITSIEYWLDLHDIYPYSGSPFSHGIMRRALEKLGISQSIDSTYESKLEIRNDRTIDQKEHAVLERLCLGDLEILANTLVGSPLTLSSLVKKGSVVLVPAFHHLGINQDFIIHGPYDEVRSLARMVPESITFRTENNAYSIVSTPSSWHQPIIFSAANIGLELYPIVSIDSPRKLLRDEVLFTDEKEPFLWS